MKSLYGFVICLLFFFQKTVIGVDCDEAPPVPMPNTEVKLIYVENTWLVTTWEDRKMPIPKPID